jgi:hypothetical protein
MLELPSCASVESIPLGERHLQIKGNDSWNDAERCMRVRAMLNSIFETAIEMGLSGAELVRLVVFSGDISSEIYYWQDQLNRPRLVTEADQGMVVGKALTWRPGTTDSILGLVILEERIALSLLEPESEATHGMALQSVLHEIAHVHDFARQLRAFGDQPHPSENDWLAIRRFLASNAWSEYFAELTAFKQMTLRENNSYPCFSKELIGDCILAVTQGIERYHIDGDIAPMWSEAVEKLSSVYCALGRGYGCADSLRLGDCDEMLASSGIQSAEWLTTAAAFRKECQSLQELEVWRESELDSLCAVVEQGFKLSGLQPRQLAEGNLWVGVTGDK